MLENDRRIKISSSGSRKSAKWPTQELWLSELYARLQTPIRGSENMAEYLSMKKAQQDTLKDVGGFVGGTLQNNVRKAGAVVGRDLITLDMDHVAAGGTDDLLKRLAALGCGYAVYSTRKHSPTAPRLRAVIPTDRTLTADEYEPAARKLAEMIDPEMRIFDRTTFEPSRLMYWPSCCADSEYICRWEDKPLASADGLLATYADWHDMASWPQCPDAKGANPPNKQAERQEDPTSKSGIIGAFCRTYDVYAVLDKFLPGVYDPVDNTPDRYTYTGGSTTGGAIVYENGKFLYSHHATDPAGGQLCNAFDLVRLHRFGDQDDNVAEGTPVSQYPSYKAMTKFAAEDDAVAALAIQEKQQQAVDAFGEAPEPIAPAREENWRLKPAPGGNGFDKTVDNILTILENDVRLRGRTYLDTFANRGIAIGPFPWDSRPGQRIWSDNDDAGVRWYIEKQYQITGEKKIYDALSICGQRHAVDPVCSYLESLKWDGAERLDRLFVDYLGAEDNEYTRAVARKAFCAAVARALNPGVKFDTMTILSGAQGIGKSTLLRLMGKGWFSDSLKTFEGKEACELIQGSWIIEVGELEAMNRAEVGRVKQFLSQSEDIFRTAYGRRTNPYPRRCVFFGTSNNSEYLRDRTGGRRFWPIDCGRRRAFKNVFCDLAGEVDQIWAEAVTKWRIGETLYLTGSVKTAAEEIQEAHREVSPREGLILEYLERPVPANWSKLDANARKMYMEGNLKTDEPLIPRDRVCALEVWCEILGGDQRNMRYSDAQEINSILEHLPGWERTNARFGSYGKQRGFIRKKVEHLSGTFNG